MKPSTCLFRVFQSTRLVDLPNRSDRSSELKGMQTSYRPLFPQFMMKNSQSNFSEGIDFSLNLKFNSSQKRYTLASPSSMIHSNSLAKHPVG